MSTSVATVVNEQYQPAWHAEFLAHLLPRLKAHARYRFRDLPSDKREEAEAEAVAVALVFFVRLVERGKTPSAFALRIARHAVLRFKSGRLVGSGDRSQDVMSRLGRQRRGSRIESLDAGRQTTRGVWQEIVVADRRSTPAETAACRIDIGAWLAGMTLRRRAIAESLAAGYRTEEVARRFHLSSSRISQLRWEFDDSWRAFQQQADELQFAAA